MVMKNLLNVYLLIKFVVSDNIGKLHILNRKHNLQ